MALMNRRAEVELRSAAVKKDPEAGADDPEAAGADDPEAAARTEARAEARAEGLTPPYAEAEEDILKTAAALEMKRENKLGECLKYGWGFWMKRKSLH